MKQAIVREREYKNIRTVSEDVAEFEYSPVACKKTYRMVVLRKNLSVERGEQRLFDDIVYFFYLTNKRDIPAEEIVWESNERCNQENLIAQLKSGVHALETPLDNLLSNWAYMVIASLAWSLKAWFGLLLSEKGRWASKHKAEKRAVVELVVPPGWTAVGMGLRQRLPARSARAPFARTVSRSGRSSRSEAR